jgi:hypothetical protein
VWNSVDIDLLRRILGRSRIVQNQPSPTKKEGKISELLGRSVKEPYFWYTAPVFAAVRWEADNKRKSDKREEYVMQRMGEVFIPLAIAFMFLFALNVSGFAQATVPSPGTARSPGMNLPAQNPGSSYQPGIGTTTPSAVPVQPPKTTNPNITPNSNVMPNSTLPNRNPNMVPSPYPNTFPNVPYPNNANPRMTSPTVTPSTKPDNFNYGNPIPGTGSGAFGAGVPPR